MTASEIEQAVRDARGFVVSGGAGYVATEIARALICLSEAMGGEQAAFLAQRDECERMIGEVARLSAELTEKRAIAVRALDREEKADAEIARLDWLAKAERAYRVAVQMHAFAGRDGDAVVETMRELRTAGGEP